ncbi:MAG: hypothetical protein ACO1N7_06505 [Sphingobacteriaceae bacterium]
MLTNQSTQNVNNVLVFKTNLRFKRDIEKVKPLLEKLTNIENWNIDRDDIDKVLRVQSSTVCSEQIVDIIKSAGYACEEL